ncbi:MAG TPA: Ig-like domain-containing protein, partial [Bacteroidota bacterium]|nr:Ig-like domain-containing protein [Bacteroidota bacterium]
TTFVPEPYFRVRGFWPEDGAVGVGPTAWLSFEFNSGVDSSITPYLRIEPKAEFNVQFYSYQAHQIYISPGTSWSGLTTYTVLFDSGAPDTAGNRSRETFRSSFTTGGFGILDFYPVDSSQGVSLYSALSIYFTMPLDTASIRAALSIEPPTVHTLRVFPSSRPDHLLIEPDSGWDELTMYTVTFDTNLRSFSGSRLAEPVRSTFTTARFRVTASIDGYWPNGVSRFPYISVGANGPLRESSIPGSVRIVPAVPLNTLMGSNGRYFTVAPAELLAPSTQYTLTIDTTLQTKAGIRLSTPFTFSFRTAPLE